MIKTDSIKYQLLEMVGLCGEFPSGQLNRLIESDSYAEKVVTEYSCAMKSHFRKFGNQMSGSGNHLCNYASLLA